ncbi:MAG: DUF839 domain-containing protein [Leptospirales bacterium]|jgi:secreted PhoX family phosphatase
MHPSRREFLRFMGRGAAAFGAGSLWAAPLLNAAGCRPAPDSASKASGVDAEADNSVTGISPGREDVVRLARGLDYRILIREGDRIHKTQDLRFGSNNDFLAFFPDSRDPNRGVLWVNHEFPCMLIDEKSGAVRWSPRNEAEFARSRSAVGGSRLALRRNSKDDPWELDPLQGENFRLDGASRIALSRSLGGRMTAEGTLGNCAGGVTPWGTLLTCEENHIYYYGETRWKNGAPVEFLERRAERRINWQRFRKNSPDDYGWVVEVDLNTGKAVKQIALGRCFHECATVTAPQPGAGKGRVAVYSGDDTVGGCIYKFVSERAGSLASGVLYAADTEGGRWLELSPSNPALKEFGDLETILIHARDAALMAGATPQDRPEDIEISPHEAGVVYISLTNHTKRRPANYYGSILKLSEAGGDPLALDFKSETFLPGGPDHQNGDSFACPDNMAFDPRGNLWLTCDISEAKIGAGPYAAFGNNGLYWIPMNGPRAGKIVQMAHAPIDAEFTGLRFAPDGRTLFVSVQHPGSRTKHRDEPTSVWPDGPRSDTDPSASGFPKSAVITITGPTLDQIAAV